MKKALIFILLLISFIFISDFEVRAEVLPYQSVSVTIKGVDKPYKLELLYKDKLPSDKEKELMYINYYNRFGETVPLFYKNFTDEGYIIASFYRGRDTFPTQRSDHNYLYPYLPPRTFKLMLLFEDDTYITSNVVSTKLFNAQVTWDLSNLNLDETQTNIGIIKEIIPRSKMSIDFLSRIIFVVILEVFILFLFRYRLKESFLLVLLTNIITQTFFAIYMFKARYYTGPYLGEYVEIIANGFLLIIIEGILYGLFLNEKSFNRAFFYNLTANIAAIGLSILLMIMSWTYF